MNLKVYLLAAAILSVGLVELIVGGVLPEIAADLNISLGTAGQLISVYALVLAISGPVLLVLTAKTERKRLYLISMFIFFLGNVMTYLSPNFMLVMIARVFTAMSAALVTVLSLTIAARIVLPTQRARAIGLISVGISSSLVLGVPIGILVSEAFGWRILFLGIAVLSIGSMILIALFLERIPAGEVQPLSTQLKALGNGKIVSAHLATVFTLAGHYTVYAYFNPFLATTLQLNQTWISVFYFIFGISAISGGIFGGALANWLGARKSILLVIGAFAIALFSLPLATYSIGTLSIVIIVWGALSWSLSPPMQDYLIQTDPVTSDIQQSFNNSALQVGISIGSAIGGVVLSHTNAVVTTAPVGGFVVLVAFLCALISLKKPTPHIALNQPK